MLIACSIICLIQGRRIRDEVRVSAEAVHRGLRLNVTVIKDDIILVLCNEGSQPAKLWNTLLVKENGTIPLVSVHARNQTAETQYFPARVRGYGDSYLKRQPTQWEVLEPGRCFEAKTTISAYVRPMPVLNQSVTENSWPIHGVIPSVNEVQVHCLVELGENREESLKVGTRWISRHYPEQAY